MNTPVRSLAVLGALVAGLLTVPTNTPNAEAAAFGSRIVGDAARYRGAPYVYGASGPRAFDCSGYTAFVYRHFGIRLPRTAAEQYTVTTHLPRSARQPGDLLFFADSRGAIYHVAIFAGGWSMWVAPRPGKRVMLERIWSPYFLVGRPTRGGVARPAPVRRPAPRPAPARRPAPAVPRFPGTILTMALANTVRPDVRLWQARMRQRGWGIAVDGEYGPATAGVATAFERDKHLPVQVPGRVDARVWTLSWTAPITP